MRSKWTDKEDDVIRLSFWYMDSHQIATMLPGRTSKSVQHRAKKLGLFKSPKDNGMIQSHTWLCKLESRIGEQIETWLKRRYIEEKATYREITKELGINTRSLMKLMNMCGVDPISPREAVRRQIEDNPNFLKQTLHSPESQKARALSLARSRQTNWMDFCNEGEIEFLEALELSHLRPFPQYAVESFNIDFAFPFQMLAVELDSRWHNSPKKRPMDKKKDERLKGLGWTVLRLDTRTSTSFNVNKVKAALNSLASTQP